MQQLAFDLSAAARGFSGLCGPEEEAVALALRWGRENARRVADLAAEAGLSPRHAQELIQHLLLKHHVPVGTAMAEPFGNYLINSDEDLAETVSLLRSRGLSNLVRAAALKRMSLRRFLLELPLEG